MTPKTPAVSSNNGELSPVPYSINKEGKAQETQHKASSCEDSEELVTVTREDGKTVIGYNLASPTTTEEERDKWEKERNKMYDELEEFWKI